MDQNAKTCRAYELGQPRRLLELTVEWLRTVSPAQKRLEYFDVILFFTRCYLSRHQRLRCPTFLGL